MTRKFKYKPDHIIDLIESVEMCKLLDCNKSRGHYTFYRTFDWVNTRHVESNNPNLRVDLCFISVTVSKDGRQLHAMYNFPITGNIYQRTFK